MKRLYMLLISILLVSVSIVGCGTKDANSGDVPPTAGTSNGDGEEASSQPGFASDESDGFRAEVTSATSVMLSWLPAEGATQYIIEGSVGELDYFRVATLDADATSFEAFPVPDEAVLNFRLSTVSASGSQSIRDVTVETPTETPNPYTVEVTLEETQGGLIGFDPSTFDPSTFDPSSLDPSLFDPENFDPSNFLPQPATVTQVIGPAGGTLEVTSSSGTSYLLSIPEGALPFELEISMTPVAALGGLPAEVDMLAAVQIEPEGFSLNAPASLTITSPGEVESPGDRMLVGIGFGAGGSDFHFFPLGEGDTIAANQVGSTRLSRALPRPDAIGPGGLSSSMLQSQGVARASRNAINQTARNHPPSDRSRTTRQRAAAQDAGTSPNSAGGDELFPLVPPFENWLGQNIEKRATENNSNTGTYRELFEAMSDFEFLLEKWGDNLTDEEKDRIWEPMVEAVHKRLTEAAEASCMTDAHMYGIQLAERLDNPASAFDRELLRRFKVKYGAEGTELIRKAKELAERCPLFLLIDSDITHTDLDGFVDMQTKITADIKLQWRFGGSQRKPYLVGTGKIAYGTAEYRFDDGCLAKPDTVDGSWFTVQKLSPTFKQDGTLDNFELQVYKATGRTQDTVVIFAPEDSACKEGPQGNKGPGGDVWWTNYGSYMLVHGGFPVKDWVIRAEAGLSTIADKTIEHAGDTIDLGYLTGTTKFRLVNRGAQ